MNNMTRCLDCGSPRTADQCPACGLTSAAAEVMFRRRFMKRTGVFLAGSLAFPYISQIYPPLDVDLMLVVFGVIFFVALTLAVILDRRARRRQELEMLTARETELLEQIARGLQTKEIADLLGISNRTIGSHLRNIYEKLHVRSRAAAVARFLQRDG